MRVCMRCSTYKRHAIFNIEMHALCPILEKYRCLGFWLPVLPTNLGQKKRVPSGKPPKTKFVGNMGNSAISQNRSKTNKSLWSVWVLVKIGYRKGPFQGPKKDHSKWFLSSGSAQTIPSLHTKQVHFTSQDSKKQAHNSNGAVWFP